MANPQSRLRAVEVRVASLPVLRAGAKAAGLAIIGGERAIRYGATEGIDVQSPPRVEPGDRLYRALRGAIASHRILRKNIPSAKNSANFRPFHTFALHLLIL